MRRFALAAALLALATPALATEGEKKKPELQAVELSPVGLPIVWKGRLVNYVFTSVRVNLAPNVDAGKERVKEPYYRDALVRAGHRTPFVDAHDLTRVNEAAIRQAMLPLAVAIAGPRAVTGVVITAQQPQRRSGLPKLDGGAPAPARPPIP